MFSTALLFDPSFQPYVIVFAAIVGACIGSFLSLVTYRLPLDEKIGATRSRCPSCSTVLRLPDLVPVLSWVASRGKCRHCKTRIGKRYLLTELACAAGAALAFWHYGVTFEALAITGLWWCVVAIFVTDLEHYIILDEVQLAIAIFGALYVYATDAPWGEAAIAALAGLAIGLVLKYGFIIIRHKDGLGMGDVKFLTAAGIWLVDAANFIPFLFISGVLGVVTGLGWQAIGKGERFPFGPALAMALVACVVFPHVANDFWQLYGLIEQ